MSGVEQLRDTIVAKSDQLNADDLIAGPVTVTVRGVKRVTDDQPVIIEIDGGHQPYKPCKSMRRVLIAAWGDDGREWAGRSMTLHCDPEVMFGGVKVGGIRISHLSHIESPEMSVSMSVKKGRKGVVSVKRLAPQVYPADRFAAELPKMLAAIASGKSTPEKIIAHCEKTAPLTPEQRAQITAPAVSGTDDEVF